MKEIKIGNLYIHDKNFGLSASIIENNKVFTTILNPELLYEIDIKGNKYFSEMELLLYKTRQNNFANVDVIIFKDLIPFEIEKLSIYEALKIKNTYDKNFIMTLTGILLKAINTHEFKDNYNMNLLKVTLDGTETEILEEMKNIKITY